ncbi:hypothetical protein [Pedobacter sp. GR22-10]|uniref:hypothetical protein n=1 Tax=Pedobacter sp. GR22-10 TaxID=2994472 RepID=UPI0022453D5D|nr:hypothetical protein [Pedobacter sp. GR22-10]MCX2429530.1 hypothetical protein [Pedobacter sp. GR22-10]
MVVGIVWQEAGESVAPGEQIVEIDGISFKDVDLCNLLTNKPILEGKEQATVTIKFKKGDQRKLKIEKKYF